ncbi:hypothetical protein JCM8097_002124 [Rhodosporidiobolus ruineniae]
MDDLLDLDFAAPSKPSSAGKANPQAAYSGRSAFDYLAQTQHRASPPTAPLQPTRTPTPTHAAKSQPAASGGGDAFAALFGTSPAAGAQQGQQQPLSMAERLHKDSAAKIGAYGQLPLGGLAGFASSGLSAGGAANGSRAASPIFQPPSRGASPSSSILTPTSRPLAPSPAPSASATSSSKPSDPWDFDLLNSSVPSAKPAAPSFAKADDPFDLGFDSLPSSSSPAAAPVLNGAADDFDLLDAFASPAPRVSSSSSRPAPSAAPPASAPTPSSRSASPPPHILGHLVEMGFSPSAARSALASTTKPSGEFGVEAAVDVLMGGSAPPPSRRSEPEPAPVDEAERRRRERKKREEEEWGDEDDVRIGRRRSWEFEDDERAQAQAQERERERRRRAAAAEKEQAASPSSAGERGGSAAEPARAPRRPQPTAQPAQDELDPAVQLQQQAQAALAQAQKLGFGMFKAANQMWGQAKEVAQKKLEEQRAAARAAAGLPGRGGAGEGGAGGAGQEGRPKWWTDAMAAEEEAEGMGQPNGKGKARAEQPPVSSFKDSDEEGGEDPVLQRRPDAARTRPQPPQQQQQRQQPPPAAAPAPSEYRSPFRRAKAAPPPVAPEADLLSGASAAAAPPLPASATRRSPAPSSAPSSAPTRSPAHSSRSRAATSARTPVSISPSALSAALKHKETGNSHFKLGRFGDASAAYSAALDAVPAQWLGRVVLLNNRAQARLRSGEEKAAAVDCSETAEILALALGPSGASPASDPALLAVLEVESSSLPREVLDLAGAPAVDLRDHLGKALGRRAKAYEAQEKWEAAKEDWERLLRFGDEKVLVGAGGRKVVNEGAGRCRKMLGGGGGGSSSPAPNPKPASSTAPRPAAPARPRPPPVPVQGSGDAVRALQASQQAAAAEDDLRHALKDTVDGRIGAWKGGKEANLRALIASLEEVLWPELGWKKVGMHELISEGALKVRYVRAIAKVHPDKLNVNNTTVEQRMVAGLVFAALNDAWNAHK